MLNFYGHYVLQCWKLVIFVNLINFKFVSSVHSSIKIKHNNFFKNCSQISIKFGR